MCITVVKIILLHLQQYYASILIYKKQVQILMRINSLKKIITITLLACFTIMSYAPCYSISTNSNTKVKKTSIRKSHKQRAKSEQFKYEYINYDWWKNFDDEVLVDYIDKAIKNNYDLKMATIAVDEYYQVVRMQFSKELPNVAAAFSPALVKMPGSTKGEWTFATPAIAQYELDLFLKNRDKTKAREKEYEQSLQNERAAYISIASAVGTTYLNIVKLDKMIELQEKIVQDRETIYNLMLARNKEGLTSTSDTVKANKSYIAGQTSLTEYKKQRSVLLNQLCVLIGENPNNADKLVITPYDDINFSGVIPTEISSEIIEQRPDYIKAEKMVEKAGIDVRLAKKEFLPSFNITGLALLFSGNFGSMWTTKNGLMALAGAVNWPLFTGGSRFSNLKLKKDTYERVLNNYYQTNLNSIKEINDALVAINLDGQKLSDTERQSALEVQDFELNTARYEQGTISKLDLVQLRENVLSTDKLVANQKIDCFIDYIGLYKAVGSKL